MVYTVQEVRAFLEQNPNISDQEVAGLMDQYGVDPQTMADAYGTSYGDAMNRYTAAGGRAFAQPQTGLSGSENAMQAGLQSALSALMEGAETGRADIGGARDLATQQATEAFARGEGYFDPYQQAGQQALGQQAALSGAQGQEAFNQAYTDSPYMRFLQEQGEQGVIRNAAAMGGLGGGNVQKELSRFNQGLAGQGLQQQIQNLGALSGQGLSAAGGAGQLAGQGGQVTSGITSQAGRDLANIATTTGQQAANYGFQTGQALAGNRMNVGNQLAQGINQATGQMSNLAYQGGQDVSNVYGQQAGNLAGLLTGAGTSQADLMRLIAQLNSGAAQTASGQAAGLNSIGGIQETQGIISRLAGGAEGMGTLMALSDERLKEDINLVGKTLGGENVYSWKWKDKNIKQPNIGVIAQEIQKSNPSAVKQRPDGYLMVDYSKVH